MTFEQVAIPSVCEMLDNLMGPANRHTACACLPVWRNWRPLRERLVRRDLGLRRETRNHEIYQLTSANAAAWQLLSEPNRRV